MYALRNSVSRKAVDPFFSSFVRFFSIRYYCALCVKTEFGIVCALDECIILEHYTPMRALWQLKCK